MELLTHTKRRDFLNCPRYFWHRHEERLESRSKKPGRRRGTIFGDALLAARDWQECDGRWDENDVIPEGLTEDMVGIYLGAASAGEAAQQTVAANYRQLEDLGAVDDQDDADTLDVEEVKMRVMVERYIARYGLAPRREVEFTLPLTHHHGNQRSRSKTWRRAGKLDGVEIVGKKQARVIEDKLVKSIQRAMVERLPLDAQSSEYVDALLANGWSATVAYRHTRWPGVNPVKEKVLKTKTNPAETLEEFEERLHRDVDSRLDWYFDEQIVFFPQEHLEDYRAGRWGTAVMIQNARALARKEGYEYGFPMNPSRCWEYGGCEFIPLCTKQQDARDRYVVVEDNQELSINVADSAAEQEV